MILTKKSTNSNMEIKIKGIRNLGGEALRQYEFDKQGLEITKINNANLRFSRRTGCSANLTMKWVFKHLNFPKLRVYDQRFSAEAASFTQLAQQSDQRSSKIVP